MNGLEGGNRRPSTRQKERLGHWKTIMESGELTAVQKGVNTELRNILVNESWIPDWEKYGHGEFDVERIGDPKNFNHSGLETRSHHFRHNSSINPYTINLVTDSKELTALENQFLQAFSVISYEVNEVMHDEKNQPRFRPVQLSPDIQEAYLQGIDMHSPESIVSDNVTTFADVFRFITKDATSTEQQLTLLQRAANERNEYRYTVPETGQEIDLNPRKETDLELLARAPFGFWANTREDTPYKLDGEEVIQINDSTRPLFSDRFIYFVTREDILVVKAVGPDSLKRHGGCPVLHRGEEHQGLIPETANILIDFYEAIARRAEK